MPCGSRVRRLADRVLPDRAHKNMNGTGDPYMRSAEPRKASHLQTFRPEAIHLGAAGLLGRDAARASRR
jgi:hypothetical protein